MNRLISSGRHLIKGVGKGRLMCTVPVAGGAPAEIAVPAVVPAVQAAVDGKTAAATAAPPQNPGHAKKEHQKFKKKKHNAANAQGGSKPATATGAAEGQQKKAQKPKKEPAGSPVPAAAVKSDKKHVSTKQQEYKIKYKPRTPGQTPLPVPALTSLPATGPRPVTSLVEGPRPVVSAIPLLEEAKSTGRQLTSAEYTLGLRESVYGVMIRRDLALWAYEQLAVDGVVSTEVYSHIIFLHARQGDVERMMTEVHKFEASGYAFTETIMTELLLCLSRHPKQYVDTMIHYYQQYLAMQPKSLWILPGRVYVAVAAVMVKFNRPEEAIAVLKNMTDVNIDPREGLCAPLLTQCLFSCDNKVLTVLASWYQHHFQQSMEYGQISRLLSIAAVKGDEQLALHGFNLISKSNYQASVSNYICLVRAQLLSGQLIPAVETLQAMELVHSPDDPDAQRHLLSLRPLLVGALGGTQAIDDLYFALVDQVRLNQQRAPRVVLDAMVVALGKQNQLDRAFASFQEYNNLFKVQPTVESYNALLQACALTAKCTTRQLLAIFQSMEAASATDPALKPNAFSYSLLMEHLVDIKDVRVLDPLLTHVLESNVDLTRGALRKLFSYYCNYRNDRAKSEPLLAKIRETSNSKQVPFRMQRKLDMLRDREVAQAPPTPVQAKGAQANGAPQ